MFMLFLNILVSGIMAPMVFMLQAFPDTFENGDRWRWYLCFVPSYPVINGLLWSAAGESILPQIRSSNDGPYLAANYWGFHNMGGDAFALLVGFGVYTTILILLESGVFKCCHTLTCRKIRPRDSSIKLDADVLEEEIRVADTPDEVIRVNDFRKSYTTLLGRPHLAVDRISFGVNSGEIFALLGVNGSGKTTIFKALTAEITQNNGEVTVESLDM